MRDIGLHVGTVVCGVTEEQTTVPEEHIVLSLDFLRQVLVDPALKTS